MARKPVPYFAGSVVIGTVIGALVGLMAAPMSGRDARNSLQRTAKGLTGRLPAKGPLSGRFVEWKTRSRATWGRVPASFLRRKGHQAELVVVADRHDAESSSES